MKKSAKLKPASAHSIALRHPLGVQPSGNMYSATKPPYHRGAGLGALAALSDELLIALLGLLDASSLARLGRASKACYVFARFDELWAELTLHEYKGDFTFERSWWFTYVKHKRADTPPDLGRVPPFVLDSFYSDLLFQPHYISTVEIDPAWLTVDTIERRANLSLAEFIEQYEKPNRPVIITDVVPKWAAFGAWGREALLARFGETRFDVSGYQMRLRDYWAYADGTRDDQPIYLFDKAFAKKAPAMAAEYEVPAYFAEDLFGALGEERRPDYRWLIIGPRRSGSVFHKDPNETSAWNALLAGRKKWIMYPPNVCPPGVHPSFDGGDVTQPVALIEWFLNFYEPSPPPAPGQAGPLEGITEPGDVIFVPRGWWHCVLNLEESVAITQNYVSARNLPAVLRFLRDKPSQVSGTANKRGMYADFRAALAEQRPAVLAAAEAEERGTECKRRARSVWGEVAAAAVAAACPWGGPGAGAGGMGATNCDGEEEEEALAKKPALAEFRFNFA